MMPMNGGESDHPLMTNIANTHEYLEAQRHNLGDQEYQISVTSQMRTLRTMVDQFEGGLTTEHAVVLLDQVREGPWAGTNIATLSSALDAAVQRSSRRSMSAKGERKPQVLEHPELFLSDTMWDHILDQRQPRCTRMAYLANVCCNMDLTNPDPRCKQRLVSILGLTDEWIQANPENAKQCMEELGVELRKARPSPRAAERPHIVEYPRNPEIAIAMIDGFAARVYPNGDGPSIDPRYTSAQISDISRNTVLRWSHTNVRAHAPGRAQSLGTMHLAASASPMGSAPNMAMSPMQQMAAMQAQMMQQNMAMQAHMMQAMQGMGMGMMGCNAMQPSISNNMMGMQPFGNGMPMFGGNGCGGHGCGGQCGDGQGCGGCGGFQGCGGGACGGALGGGVALAGRAVPVTFVPGGRQAFPAGRGHGRMPAQGPPALLAQGPPALPAVVDDPNGADDADGANDVADGAAAASELESIETLLAKGGAAAKALAKPKAKANGKKSAGAAGGGVMKKPAGAAKEKAPHWGHEQKRKQVMCRTGLAGEGQCHGIKWEVVGGKKAAEALADKWVAAEKKKRGIKD